MSKFPYRISVWKPHMADGADDGYVLPAYQKWETFGSSDMLIRNYPVKFFEQFGLVLKVMSQDLSDFILIESEEDEIKFSKFVLEWS